jgi:hypothetical protein
MIEPSDRERVLELIGAGRPPANARGAPPSE